MLLRQILLPAAIVPAAGAAVVWLLLKRGGPALAVALASSLVASTGWPRWLPVEATERLIFGVLVAGVLGLLPLARRPALAWSVRALFGLALLAALLESLLRHSWSTGQAVLWLAGLTLVWLALCWAFAHGLGIVRDRGETDAAGEASSGGHRWLSPLVRLMLLGGTAAVLGLSGSARLALLAGGLTAGTFAVEALALAFGRPAWRAGDDLAPAAAVLGLLLIGYFYASLTAGAAVALLAAWLCLALLSLRGWAWRLAPLVPLGVALALAIAAFLAVEEDPYGYYSARPAGGATATAGQAGAAGLVEPRSAVGGIGPAAGGRSPLPADAFSPAGSSSPPKRIPASRRNGNGGSPPIITNT